MPVIVAPLALAKASSLVLAKATALAKVPSATLLAASAGAAHGPETAIHEAGTHASPSQLALGPDLHNHPFGTTTSTFLSGPPDEHVDPQGASGASDFLGGSSNVPLFPAARSPHVPDVPKPFALPKEVERPIVYVFAEHAPSAEAAQGAARFKLEDGPPPFSTSDKWCVASNQVVGDFLKTFHHRPIDPGMAEYIAGQCPDRGGLWPMSGEDFDQWISSQGMDPKVFHVETPAPAHADAEPHSAPSSIMSSLASASHWLAGKFGVSGDCSGCFRNRNLVAQA
jgi:hypothetical protein